MRLANSADTEHIDIPHTCPSCFGINCIEHIDQGDEEDEQGVYGNHIIVCNICGRKTTAMDTFDDAVDAFIMHYDNVFTDNENTVLMSIEDLKYLVNTGVVPDRETINEYELRRRCKYENV